MPTSVAIISRACIFPQSSSPQSLWKNLLESRDLLTAADPERWRADPASAMEQPDWNNPAGYVRDFDAEFDADAFDIDASMIESLDPLFQWVLHTAHGAYHPIQRADKGNLAVLLGNLSLPSQGLARWTEAIWESKQPHQPLNRYMSGLPAHLVGPALGRRADAWSLDAACASSIYALSLGCEKLHRKEADIVLAGAVNRADPLFLHIGFQALQALSPTGQSRPFHRGADGLVPTEGAAFVGLKRLDDAVDHGDEILAVIHGAGLSNDGRSDGLLVPAGEGQVRAIAAAYDGIDVEPEQVSFIECHATGTPVGDGREIASLAEVFNPDEPIAIGSHKSNMGHAITAAGMAGLLKILGAMEHETLPPTIHCDDPIDELRDGPFRLVTEPEPWDERRRIAGLSAFGFGGNNSHLVIEEWRGDPEVFAGAAISTKTESPPEVVVVGAGVVSGVGSDLDELGRVLLDGAHDGSDWPLDEIEFAVEDLRFPPRDLAESLPQQLAILRAACDAVDQAGRASLEREKTGVFTGMQTDPGIVGHGLRARRAGDSASTHEELSAAAVIGSLPNIVANRINSHFDLGGVSFSASAEQHSGDVALREAFDAICRGDLDAAIVGAVEMATGDAHAAAAVEDGPHTDAAVALLLTRRDRAEADGDEILATIVDAARPAEDDGADAVRIDTPAAHSATGLLQIAAAVALPEFALPRKGAAAGIRFETPIRTDALRAAPRVTTVQRTPRPVFVDTPRIYRAECDGREVTVVAASQEELDAKTNRFRDGLDGGRPLGEGIYLRDESVDGEIAQVFTGAAAAYVGMGRALCLGFPHLVEDLADRFDGLDVATRWMFHPDQEKRPTPLDKLHASSVLSQLHSDFSRDFLGLDYDAAIGFSSGETNALFATGVWRDFDELLRDFSDSGAFTEFLGGRLDILRQVWSDRLDDGEDPRWESWRISGPRTDVDAAIAGESLVHLLLINAPDDVTIGGHAPAVHRVLDDLDGHAKSHLEYDIAVHCPEVAHFETPWRQLHTRPTHSTDVRLYGHAFGTHYEPTRENVAQALYGQAVGTVDFPALVRGAWDDGVRIFVEHGPRTTLAPWIRRILADRPHRVVSLDAGSDDTLRPLANAIGQLDAWGVDVDVEAFNDQLETHSATAGDEAKRTISFAAHPERITAPSKPAPSKPASARTAELTVLPPAPPLPRVTDPAIHAPPATGTDGAVGRPALPAYFQLQRQAFERYLDVVAAGADVHRQFLSRSHRAWQAAGPDFDASTPAAGEAIADPGVESPLFDRNDLKIHASGDISEIFGPQFARQRDYPRQVRMPEPPLLLADRVMDIDAEPGVVGTGTVWTETDITADAWYLFNGHIPPGVMIEAGQADLFLISWMGADFENQGQRIYRLLGCELTYRKGLPAAGETLRYDIHIDGHATQGDVRLFFFHYDCRTDGDIRLSVRNGQAGFFTDEELENSMGVLWTPKDAEFRDDVQLDAPRVPAESIPATLDADDVLAFAEGDPAACFGTGYERLQCHRRTPNIHHGRMCLVGDVEELTVGAGPTGRGYMRTRYRITPDRWFFDGHFKDDPCMPGTLMFEGGMQVMSLYMIALGMTLDRDGWRFEPVPDQPYQLRCRGQAIPTNEELVYEIFIEEIADGPRPRLVADILATVDGLKAFHCRGMQMQLVPDTPLSESLLVDGIPERNPRALQQGALIHDELAMRATGEGPASMCMGDRYAAFDGHRRMPRLPSEPFQFLSRIIDADGAPGDPGDRPTAIAEYDVPHQAWYFEHAGGDKMPSAVLMETVLQACGWLSLYSGVVLETDEPLFYRNLDGTATLHAEIPPAAGTLQTRTTLTRNAGSGDMTIQSFELECLLGGDVIYEMETTFGFFPARALRNQAGLPVADEERARFDADSDVFVDLADAPDRECGRLWPGDKLRMIDAVTGRWRVGDQLWFRTEKAIDAGEWFFKAHFYQDPVMPGSLGVEAMFQTLRFALLDQGYHRRFDDPHIEPVALGREVSWTYRGQVPPESERITVLLALREVVEAESATTAVADASLWVDGLKIYGAQGLAMRIR